MKDIFKLSGIIKLCFIIFAVVFLAKYDSTHWGMVEPIGFTVITTFSSVYFLLIPFYLFCRCFDHFVCGDNDSKGEFNNDFGILINQVQILFIVVFFAQIYYSNTINEVFITTEKADANFFHYILAVGANILIEIRSWFVLQIMKVVSLMRIEVGGVFLSEHPTVVSIVASAVVGFLSYKFLKVKGIRWVLFHAIRLFVRFIKWFTQWSVRHFSNAINSDTLKPVTESEIITYLTTVIAEIKSVDPLFNKIAGFLETRYKKIQQ